MSEKALKQAFNGRRGRLALAWDSIKSSFGFPAGIAMLLGAAVGLSLPSLDKALEISLPVLTFDSQSAARSLLETIATATTAVAGLSFSVTVVAITLASNQLSPRVLRSFRTDRLSQTTLALFLGTFVYCLSVLVRIGVNGEDAGPPNLSVTLAVLLAFAAFGTFAAFIAHILKMLQPSSVIASIHDDALEAAQQLFPGGRGEPEDEGRSALDAAATMDAVHPDAVYAGASGYLAVVDTDSLIEAASGHGALVRQCAAIGDYVLPGRLLAELFVTPGEEPEGGDVSGELVAAVRGSFVLGRQRTLVQDIGFPVRQLADIALKGLSPGINDPTTAENAIDAMGSFLVEFTACDRPSPVRVDAAGEARLVAKAPDLDELLRLGFEQVRIAAATHPTVSQRMLDLLDGIDGAATRAGIESSEVVRQRRLIEPNAG